MATKKATTFDFEASIEELETLVSSMEAGDMSLEESMKAFESGIRLTRQCQQALQEAEQKVQVLLDRDGQPEALDSNTTDARLDLESRSS